MKSLLLEIITFLMTEGYLPAHQKVKVQSGTLAWHVGGLRVSKVRSHVALALHKP